MKIYGAEPKIIKKALKSGEICIAVYGLGRMGLPLAGLFADSGAKVIGVDINSHVVNSVNCGECPIVGEPGLQKLIKRNFEARRLCASSDPVKSASEADVIIVEIPMILNSEHHPDLSNLKALYKEIAKGLDKGDVVIQESTVPLRTTQDVILPILEESGLRAGNFGLARCPAHVRYGSIIQDLKGSHLKVVGGIDEPSTSSAAAIYSVINKRGVITLPDSTSAEAVKLFAAVYKDVNIALANEFSMICDELGINSNEVLETLSRPPAYAPIFMPGCGVGGHCIPVCGYGISSILNKHTRLIPLARKINDGMAEYAVDLVERGLSKVGLHLDESNILILGLTYRGDLKDTSNSPAILIASSLLEKCRYVYAYDPMLKSEVERYGLKSLNYLKDVGDSVQIDAVILASDHSEFKKIDWQKFGTKMRQKIIVDGKNCIDHVGLQKSGWIVFGI